MRAKICLRMYLLGALVLLLATQTNCLIVDTEVTPDSLVNKYYTRFEEFGFDVGGSVEIRGNSGNNTAVKVYVSDESEYRERLTGAMSWSQFCEQSNPKIPFIPLDGNTYSFKIPSKGRYYFGILDCRRSIEPYFRAKLHYVLLSDQDGSQLPLGQGLLPYIESVFTAMWMLLLIAYFLYLVVERKYTTTIHFLLSGVMLCRLSVSSLNTIYWWSYATSGAEKVYLDQLSYLLFAVAEGGFFVVLYLISKGWRITRTGIPASDFRATLTATGILLLTLAFFSFYNGEYYFLTLLIMYFFIMPKIFSGISVQATQLDHQIRLWSILPMPDIVGVVSCLIKKRNMLRNLRSVSIVYILLVLASTAGVRVLIPWYFAWISTVTAHSCGWLVAAFLCFVSRPSKGLFFTSMDQLLPFIAAQQFAENHDAEEANEESLSPWDLSKTLVVHWPGESNLAVGYELSYLEEQK